MIHPFPLLLLAIAWQSPLDFLLTPTAFEGVLQLELGIKLTWWWIKWHFAFKTRRCSWKNRTSLHARPFFFQVRVKQRARWCWHQPGHCNSMCWTWSAYYYSIYVFAEVEIAEYPLSLMYATGLPSFLHDDCIYTMLAHHTQIEWDCCTLLVDMIFVLV